MSGEGKELPEAKLERERREADWVHLRIGELHENPLRGPFDARHLKSIHAHIFQDLPHHKPGVVRATAKSWLKERILEASSGAYAVHYLNRGIETRIASILIQFGGPDRLRGLKPGPAANLIADLYADLDYAHGFYEGNSRTLREFTRELALAAGFILDWVGTGVGTEERNALYAARDLAVLERAFPRLTPERAMQTQDRAEYEAWSDIERLRRVLGGRSLAAIIEAGLVLAIAD